MNSRQFSIRALVASAAAIAALCTPAFATNPYTGNGLFLDHGYVCNSQSTATIQSVVQWLAARNFHRQFLNVASFNADGTLIAANYATIGNWISTSRATDPTQKCIVYVSGNLSLVNTPSTWQNIANVCQMFLTTYAADGINLDFEPFQTSAANYIGLLQTIRNTVGSSANIGLDYTVDPSVEFSPADFHAVTSYLSEVDAMCYDTMSSSVSQYQGIISNAMTYEYANVAPGCVLSPLGPEYARSRYHNPSIENIQNFCTEVWNLAQVNKTIAIGNIGIWWQYGWDHDQTNADSMWTTYWLNR